MRSTILISLVVLSTHLQGAIQLKNCLGNSIWEAAQRKLESLGSKKCKTIKTPPSADPLMFSIYAECGDRGLSLTCAKQTNGLIHVFQVEVNSNYENPSIPLSFEFANTLVRELVPLVREQFKIKCEPDVTRATEEEVWLLCKDTTVFKNRRQWILSFTKPELFSPSAKLRRRAFHIHITEN